MWQAVSYAQGNMTVVLIVSVIEIKSAPGEKSSHQPPGIYVLLKALGARCPGFGTLLPSDIQDHEVTKKQLLFPGVVMMDGLELE